MTVMALLALVLTATTSLAADPTPGYINGNGYAETIYGSSMAETIKGFGGGDYLADLGGNDAVFGGGGDDLVRGDAGNDGLGGGAGADRIEGGTGADTVFSHGDYASDIVDCGTGYGGVRADSYDRLIGCEGIERF